MPGNKQSGMKEEPEENTKKRGNMKMKTELQNLQIRVRIHREWQQQNHSQTA